MQKNKCIYAQTCEKQATKYAKNTTRVAKNSIISKKVATKFATFFVCENIQFYCFSC